ncbi:MAG: DNA gyrase subunit A [bacterium]|nr:DNA gyrase subunit A [bacterium]
MYTLNEKITPRDIEDEMKESFATYALSVIIQRALPDARDGLKPSQRRILYAMRDLHLSPTSKHRKCAKIAGDTSGNYHPHGEAVVYPTLVRMAQNFVMRYRLVDGQGNFGSVDGDPPAAMRYTEARLTHAAMELLADIEQETVDFVPNYDETLQEPTVLPGRFPNLICNGCSGIAVGMASNIPPHNVGEVVEAIKLLLEDPEVPLKNLMQVLPGPDFPTGGMICGMEGIRQAYRIGKGRIILRARMGVEPAKSGKEFIVITEIPYQVDKTNLIDSIAELANNKVISGISDLRDESDKEGMRIIVEVKRGENARVVINQLYKHTELQKTFGAILLALDNGQPRTMGLKSLLTCYIDHRHEVIIRRTQYQLGKAEDRAHILEGFKIALDNLDTVVKIIRTSADRAAAKEKLIATFKFSDRQADAILDMRLYQLTGLEREKVENEYKELLKKIAYLKSVLSSPQLVKQIIKDELEDIKKRFSDTRRTDIIPAEDDLQVEDLIANEGCIITISHAGYIKRVPVATYRQQHRGGKGVSGMEMKQEDFVKHLFTASTHDYLLFFTATGQCHWLKVYAVPPAGRTARGKAIVNLLQMPSDEKIAALIRVKNFEGDSHLMMVTQKGVLKKTPLSAFSNPRAGGIIAIRVDEGDSLIEVKLTSGQDELVLVTRQGQSIRIHESDVRPTGRATRGVKGITLKKTDDAVVGMEVVEKDASLLVLCENGHGKRTAFDEFRGQRRGGKGVIAIKTTKRNGLVVGVLSVRDTDDIIVITAEGKMMRTSVSQIREISRNTQGVRIISLSEGDRVVDVAKSVSEGDEEGGEGVEELEDESPTEATESPENENG